MPFDYISFIKSVLHESGEEPSFDILLEAVLVEGYVKDWDTSDKWAVDENGKHIGSRDVTIDSNNFENVSSPGASISRNGYIFLPVPFAIGDNDGKRILRHIAGIVKDKGSVTVSVYPGYGVESESGSGTYPAKMYKQLPAETKTTIGDQIGNGMIIHAIDGEPITNWLDIPPPIDVDETRLSPLDVFLGRTGRTMDVPKWLEELVQAIDIATRDGKVKADLARKVRGFESSLVLSTPNGDAVLVIAKEAQNAAYVFKKRMWIESDEGTKPVDSDWDVIVSKKMKDFIARFKRRPRGTKKEDIPAPQLEAKRQPRLALRDWMHKTEKEWGIEQGYVLRRDFNKAHIIDLMNNGISYMSGLALADSGSTIEPAA
jgi:hypothetical protein